MKERRNLLLLPFLLLPFIALAGAFVVDTVPFADQDPYLSENIFMDYYFNVPSIFALATLVMLFIFIIVYPRTPHSTREISTLLLILQSVQTLSVGLIYAFVSIFSNDRGPAYTPSYIGLTLLSLFFSGCLGCYLMLCTAKNTDTRVSVLYLTGSLQFLYPAGFVSVLLLWLYLRKRDLKMAASTEQPPESVPVVRAQKKKIPEALRYLLLIPGIMMTYTILFIILAFLAPATRNYTTASLIFSVVGILPAPLNVIFVMIGIDRPASFNKLALVNIIIRLLQIPGYIINLVLGSLMMITIFTFGLSTIFLWISTLSLIVASLLAIGVAFTAVREGRLNIRPAFFLSLLNYIFCVDIIYAIVLYVILTVKRYREKHPRKVPPNTPPEPAVSSESFH